MVQIVVMDVVFVVQKSGHRLQPRLEGVRSASLRALHRAEFTLPDQSLSEVREQRQIIGTEEPGKGKLVARPNFPLVVYRQYSCVGLVFLPGVERVIHQHTESDRNQISLMGFSPISNTQQ